MALLLRDLLAIRWHDVSDDRLFGGFSTYTAVLGNWYSPGATAIEGDNVEVSEFQFGLDRAVPGIAVLLTELALPSLVAAHQFCVQTHVFSPTLSGDDFQAGGSFSGQIWANYTQPHQRDKPSPFSERWDVLTYLQLVLALLDLFEACPAFQVLDTGRKESLYAILVDWNKRGPSGAPATEASNGPRSDRLRASLKTWVAENFSEREIVSRLVRLKTFETLQTQGAKEMSSLEGVYVFIRLLLFAAISWFALCESVEFRTFLQRYHRSRWLALQLTDESLITPVQTALQRWCDRLLQWFDARRKVGELDDGVLNCAFLTLAYACDKMVNAKQANHSFPYCKRARPDLAVPGTGSPKSEAEFWAEELRLEDTRHFPFEQTLHFWAERRARAQDRRLVSQSRRPRTQLDEA